MFLRLAEHPRVVAIKEASGNLEQIARICRNRPRDVAVLAGDDAWTLPVLALGGDGVVSVASNEIPGELVALCAAARAGDWDGARRLHERWLPLFLANFAGGPNPVPVKAALALMGLLEAMPSACRSCRSTPRRGPTSWPPSGARPGRGAGGRIRARRGAGVTGDGRVSAGRRPSTAAVLADLEAGRLRAAEPDPRRRTAGGSTRR